MSRYLSSFLITATLYASLTMGLLYSYQHYRVSLETIETPEIETIAFSILQAPTLPSEPTVETPPEPMSELEKPKEEVKAEPEPEPELKPEPEPKVEPEPKEEPKPEPKPEPIVETIAPTPIPVQPQAEIAPPPPKPTPKNIDKSRPKKKVIKKRVIKKPKPKRDSKRKRSTKKTKSKKYKAKSKSKSKRVSRKSSRGGKQSRAKKSRFLSRIRSKINRNKSYPRVAKRMRRQGKVRVRFTILSSGRVGNIRVSGTKAFFKSARRAVKRAFPINASKAPFRLPKSMSITINYRLR